MTDPTSYPMTERHRKRKSAFLLLLPGLLVLAGNAVPASSGSAGDNQAATSETRPAGDQARQADSEKGPNVYTKPSDEVLRSKLTDIQWTVTQQDGTERPFANEYWDNKDPGIYVDVVSGEPLFSSLEKYKSGTGWPSFWKPLETENIVEKTDRKLFMTRTEVRSKHGDSHLGHVFNDGPKPTGLRYCMNSAALRFIPVDKLGEEGYGEYAELFEKE